MVNIRPAGASCTPEVLPPAEKAYEMDNKPNLVRVNELSGLDLEKQSHSSGRCGAFFLTSLFIELSDWIFTPSSFPQANNSWWRQPQNTRMKT